MALTETRPAAGFILSEAPGSLSRDSGTATSGQTFEAGEALMVATGKLVVWDGGTDSDVIGYSIYEVDASAADVANVAYISRLAELNVNLVSYPSGELTDLRAQSLEKFIVLR
jgi:hypothetical protein